METVNSDN